MIKRKRKASRKRNKIKSRNSYNFKPHTLIILCKTVNFCDSMDLGLGTDFPRSVTILKRLFSDP